MHADARRHAAECKERKKPRQHAEEPGEPDCETERGADAARDKERLVRRHCEAEQRGAEGCAGEPGDPLVARATDEEHCEAEARDRASDLRELPHLTSTRARATWPRSVTVNVYRPRNVDARNRSTGPDANDFRLPSFHV